MCITDRSDMNLASKVALNRNTTTTNNRVVGVGVGVFRGVIEKKYPETFSTLKVKQFLIVLTLYHTTLGKKLYENIAEKGENAANQHFILFQQCFIPFP